MICLRSYVLQNDLTFLRLRSKKHEIMVAPDKDYLLIIIQDPNNL
jgi:dynein light chain roadblock-type